MNIYSVVDPSKCIIPRLTSSRRDVGSARDMFYFSCEVCVESHLTQFAVKYSFTLGMILLFSIQRVHVNIRIIHKVRSMIRV